MSLLGIDIGTTGCKSTAFSLEGNELAMSYREYEIITEKEGFAELDSHEVWQKVKDTIKEVASCTTGIDPVTALSVSSMGEAFVPVTKDRKIVGSSILGSDLRGEEFLKSLLLKTSPEAVFQINGNIPDIFYSSIKIAWIKKYKPEIYSIVDYFLIWADFVCFMLGGRAITNYSHAGRTLLFNIHEHKWSDKLIQYSEIDFRLLAPPCPSGVFLGYVSDDLSMELNLNNDVAIISGGHDQCCATLGCGIATDTHTAMYGFGTYNCMVPVLSRIPSVKLMFENKLNIEHHVVPGLFVSFIYNLSGGALVKWFKKTFSGFSATVEYDSLFNEITDIPNDIIVIPRFGPTGPPDFLKESAGTISGLSFYHNRGDILLAIMEGITFYFKEYISGTQDKPFNIDKLIACGGGSRSKKWLQVTADVLNIPVIKNKVTEAGTLGAAILAGLGNRTFTSTEEAVVSMVKKDGEFLPIKANVKHYENKFIQYQNLYSFLK